MRLPWRRGERADDQRFLVVGLGNPGREYAADRHNVGWMVVEELARRHGGSWKGKFNGQLSEIRVDGHKLALLKPETYMNASGRSVRAAVSCFGLTPSDVLVVHDELDISFGELRLKSGGGDGGHRGLRSISAELADPGYGRLRVGIGRPPPHFQGDVADFVLQAFALEERTELPRVLTRTCEAIDAVIRDGLARTMNRTNQRMVR